MRLVHRGDLDREFKPSRPLDGVCRATRLQKWRCQPHPAHGGVRENKVSRPGSLRLSLDPRAGWADLGVVSVA